MKGRLLREDFPTIFVDVDNSTLLLQDGVRAANRSGQSVAPHVLGLIVCGHRCVDARHSSLSGQWWAVSPATQYGLIRSGNV